MSERKARCRAALKALARLEPEVRSRLLGRLPEPVDDIAWNAIMTHREVLLCDPSPPVPARELDEYLNELAGLDPRGCVALVLRAVGVRWEPIEQLTGVGRHWLRLLWAQDGRRENPGVAENAVDALSEVGVKLAPECGYVYAQGDPAPAAPLPDLRSPRKSLWNAALVFERVEECVDVVGRMPGPFVPRLRSSRLPIVHDAEGAGHHAPVVRRPPPPPDAIRRADEVLGWLNELPPDDARALWLRAARQSWRKVGAAIGLSHEGARHRVTVTLVALATWLDEQNVPVRGRPRRRREPGEDT